MIEPKFIIKEAETPTSLDYEKLLSEGIEWIQKFSGNQWTDYNYHDPGITFLEQICFAITDLGYKVNFPIEDILLAYTDKFDLEKNNLLIPPDKILPSSPLTSNDYRKIILDLEDNVKNCWVYPIVDNIMGISGIFDVMIQLKDNQTPEEIEASVSNVERILMENRSLATDFNPVVVLKEDKISLAGQISINSFVLGESVLAEIFQKIESKLNKEIQFYDYNELLEKEDYVALFSGPIQKNKFISESELKRKTNEIYQYEIKEIIQSIEGVISVNNLTIFKNGIKMFDDTISFEQDCYPSLEKNLNGFKSNTLIFNRNDVEYEIDAIILNQLYDSITLQNKNTYLKPFKSNRIINSGRFPKKDIEQYYSIQNEFPEIYGLKEREIPSNSEVLRKAQVNQLKGYLLFFDQIMANFLSQLVNVRNLFSIEGGVDSYKTYFNQVPEIIADIKKVIGKDTEGFLAYVNAVSEDENVLIHRKQYVVDHLISRFGEVYDTSLLSKLNTLIFDDLSDYEIQLLSLEAKFKYAKALVHLGRNKSKAFNYKLKYDIEGNISGLAQRLNVVLNLNHNSHRSCLEPLFELSEIDKINEEWKIKVIEIENGPSLSILSTGDFDPLSNEAQFYCTDYDTLKSLFLYAHKRKSFKIVKSKSKFHLLYSSPKQSLPIAIFQSEELQRVDQALLTVNEKFKQLNADCESFFFVENILLRPLIESNFQLNVLSDDGIALFKSYYNADFKDLRDIKDDLWVVVLKRENYSIEKDENAKKYMVVIYDILNNPILKSERFFNSKAVAEIEINRSFDFFVEKRKSKSNLDDFTTITLVNGNSNKFPSDFPYSNHLNFMLPDWPFRFQNSEFKSQIFDVISEYIPVHLSFDIHYLDFENMQIFEDTYLKWLNFKEQGDTENTEIKSIQLIQLIMSYKSYERH
jgi:hypothetical protein